MGRRGEAADTPIEMNQVDHPAAHRDGGYPTEVLEIDKIEDEIAVPLLDHQVGLLHITSIDPGIMQAANFARDLLPGSLAPRQRSPAADCDRAEHLRRS